MLPNRPDSTKDLEESDLIQLSRSLLGAIVTSTNMLDSDVGSNPERLKEARTVLGFLNSAISAQRTKMTYLKMTGVSEKIAAVRDSWKR